MGGCGRASAAISRWLRNWPQLLPLKYFFPFLKPFTAETIVGIAMNDTAEAQFSTDSQHTLQWSAFKPRAIASKPLPLTNFDNPLPFISIAADHDKRKWESQGSIDEHDRKKHRKHWLILNVTIFIQ